MIYQSFVEKALHEASEIALSHFGKVSGTIKGQDNNQVLTEADLAIGKFLIEKISQEYPDYNIIDEEAGVIDKKSRFTWVIDPIDGTSNFAQGLPHFGIMLGLLEDGIPVAGGVVLPIFSEMYLAEKGKGAFCNGESIQVSQEKKLLNCLVAYGIDAYQEDPQQTYAESKFLGELVLRIRNLRITNSAFDYMMVARGKYGAFLNQTSKIWDNVAPKILVEEAGGIYTDFWGKPLNFVDPLAMIDQNFTLCYAAPELHNQIQKIIAQCWR